MKATRNKDLNKILDRVRKRGATIDSKGPHVKVRFPNGRLVIVGSTPSDHRAILNIERHLRHAEG